MRWSGATGAIASCKNRSTGYVRKPRSAPAWRWTCGEKPKGQGVTKLSTPYMRYGLPAATRYPCYSLAFSAYFLCHLHLEQLQLDELYAVLRAFKAGKITA